MFVVRCWQRVADAEHAATTGADRAQYAAASCQVRVWRGVGQLSSVAEILLSWNAQITDQGSFCLSPEPGPQPRQ